jgi:hypothetical protein
MSPAALEVGKYVLSPRLPCFGGAAAAIGRKLTVVAHSETLPGLSVVAARGPLVQGIGLNLANATLLSGMQPGLGNLNQTPPKAAGHVVQCSRSRAEGAEHVRVPVIG